MTSAPVRATSDLMALICLIGGAVRAAGAMELLMPLVAMGGYCPSLALALRMWVVTEERYAAAGLGQEMADVEAGDEVRPGWVGREGPVLLWRHVTRLGLVVVIPVRDACGDRRPVYAAVESGLIRRDMLVYLLSACVFLWGLALVRNCVHIVPGC